jgi:LAS superfamily LD-carboxypeptidase LdcB
MLTVAQLHGKNKQHLRVCQQGHLLRPSVCRAFNKMQLAAAADGIDLHIASSFRDFERQLLIWNNKWLGLRPVLSLSGEPLDLASMSDVEKLHAILTWSALPGASRHHWGTDLDVYDKAAIEASGHSLQLHQAEYDPGGPCYILACWLDEHAAEFNFSRPYQHYTGGVAAEAWHLSYQPLAQKIAHKQNSKRLKKVIQQADIQGKNSILKNLDLIFSRYILNQGNL